MGKLRSLFSPASWPSWMFWLYRAVDAWGNTEFMRGKIGAMNSVLNSAWAILLAFAWLFIIAFGWHTKVLAFVRRRYAETSIKRIEGKPGRVGKCSGCGLQHFFGSRYALARERPLKQIFKNTKTIWAYWHTGTIAWSYGLLDEKLQPQPLRRLIMPNPYGSAPDVLARIGGKEPSDLVKDIEAMTREAVKANIPVKWFDGDLSNTLMLGEPLDQDDHIGDKEWAQSEWLFFKVSADERPSFWAPREEYEMLVLSLHKTFTTMWNQSHPPKLRD